MERDNDDVVYFPAVASVVDQGKIDWIFACWGWTERWWPAVGWWLSGRRRWTYHCDRNFGLIVVVRGTCDGTVDRSLEILLELDQ